MKRRTSWIAAVVMMAAVPAWAHCGKCGVGDEKKAEGNENAHAHGDHGHAHAEVGKPAPDFTLKDAEGREHKLSDQKGNVVVLEWTNHECPVVNRYHTSKTIKETMAKFEGKPVTWWAIDSSHFCNDKVEGIREWSKSEGVTYPILLDAPGKVGHLYGAKTTPHMFVIDKNGVLAYMGSVDDDKHGDKEDARNYVAEAVTSLLEGSTVAVGETKPFGCSVKYKKAD